MNLKWMKNKLKTLSAVLDKAFKILLPSLMPKQLHHSLKETSLSLSASHLWKKTEVQCSIGTRGTRNGASSEWERNLQQHSVSTSLQKKENLYDDISCPHHLKDQH